MYILINYFCNYRIVFLILTDISSASKSHFGSYFRNLIYTSKNFRYHNTHVKIIEGFEPVAFQVIYLGRNFFKVSIKNNKINQS